MIVLLTNTLSPAAGGLSASVPNVVRSLIQIGAEQVVVFGLEDPDNPDAAQQWGPRVHAHRLKGPRAFGYAPGLAATLAEARPAIIDVQGLWTFPSLANLRHHRRYGTPYLVTPRGMLDPWARERSWWKKRAVRLWFEDAHLAGAACLRATAEMEAEHFRSFGLRNPIAVVPNGIEMPDLRRHGKSRRRRMLFLSRIHPKKGIRILLQSWKALETMYPDWDLVIAGPDEVGHELEMKSLAKQLGLQRVDFIGPAYGDEKAALYRSADVFVLPTHAENFGLVVGEALSHEVPVITTRNAPWDGLERNRCGWWIPLEQSTLDSALADAMSRPREELQQMGRRGRQWVGNEFSWDRVAEQMLTVYEWVVHGGIRPDCIID